MNRQTDLTRVVVSSKNIEVREGKKDLTVTMKLKLGKEKTGYSGEGTKKK